MNLKTKKWFFLGLLSLSSVAFGYRLVLLITDNGSITDYAIAITFFLVCIMSLIEWISIRKKIGEI